MRALRWLLHLAAGLVLYQALVVLGGMLAAIGTPQGYFEFFGRDWRELALGLWSTATFAVPLGLAAGAGTRLWQWLTLRLGRQPARSDRVAFVVGVFASWLFWQLSFFLVPDVGTELSWASFWRLFWNTHVMPLWHLPSAWAAWLGIGLGLRRQRVPADGPTHTA
jgi:hypothetical protein